MPVSPVYIRVSFVGVGGSFGGEGEKALCLVCRYVCIFLHIRQCVYQFLSGGLGWAACMPGVIQRSQFDGPACPAHHGDNDSAAQLDRSVTVKAAESIMHCAEQAKHASHQHAGGAPVPAYVFSSLLHAMCRLIAMYEECCTACKDTRTALDVLCIVFQSLQ